MFFNLMDNIRRNRKNVSTRAYLSRIYIRILICDFFFFFFFQRTELLLHIERKFRNINRRFKVIRKYLYQQPSANRN